MTQTQFNKALVAVQDRLWYFALSLTSDREKARELLQETSLRALANRDKFAHNTDFRAWTFSIMRNIFLNNHKREVRTKKIFDESSGDFHLLFPKNNIYPSPESFYSAKEIRQCIHELADEYRLPFSMFLDGYSYKELAACFHLNLGTLKSRIFFSRKKLKKALTG